ncbi:MAG TPA: efflux RND transporter permease subunit, partial [Spirochaetota bacterium]|nr:efflux RND transporter permease subunit [Spirochaetota bacterium]
MPAKIIKCCAQNYLLTNYTVLVIFISGLYFWQHTNKEEMPNVEFPFVRVSANYSGATPEEVEYFITKPIEDALKGLDGIHSIRSTSSSGSCSL